MLMVSQKTIHLLHNNLKVCLNGHLHKNYLTLKSVTYDMFTYFYKMYGNISHMM